MHWHLQEMSRAMRPKLNTDHSRWTGGSQQKGASYLSYKKALRLPNPGSVCVALKRSRKIDDDSAATVRNDDLIARCLRFVFQSPVELHKSRNGCTRFEAAIVHRTPPSDSTRAHSDRSDVAFFQDCRRSISVESLLNPWRNIMKSGIILKSVVALGIVGSLYSVPQRTFTAQAQAPSSTNDATASLQEQIVAKEREGLDALKTG